jgi:hypothetical protein
MLQINAMLRQNTIASTSPDRITAALQHWKQLEESDRDKLPAVQDVKRKEAQQAIRDMKSSSFISGGGVSPI